MTRYEAALFRFQRATARFTAAAAELEACVLRTPPSTRQISPEISVVSGVVCRRWGLTHQDLVGPRRPQAIALPRQIAFYLLRKLTVLGSQEIGRAFARDHGTVLWAVESVSNRAATDANFRAGLREAEQQASAALAALDSPRVAAAVRKFPVSA